MPLIGITACRKLEDYRQAVLHVGGEVRILDPSMTRRRRARRHRRPAADRRRRCRAGAVRRRRRTRRSSRPIPGATNSSSALDRGRARARPADSRHLPRHPGAERRLRRHARAGHPVAGARRAARTASTVPPHQPYSLAHEVWLEKDSLLCEADARAAERRRRLRGEQPASSGGEARGRRASSCPRRRPTASSKRSKIRPRASASASSGIRRTSAGPASSAAVRGLSRGGGEAAQKRGKDAVSSCGSHAQIDSA